ncbi:MAG: family 10 glycosylhydrolase [Chthoniobacterales bacterium]|nr:family 10 glycosylhydrolase [Chthoniobacterales bacterium]
MKILLALFAFLSLMTTVHAEFRGAWIASVYNINFPSAPGLSPETQRAQAIRLLDAAKSAGLNAVLLQVRPESDALYASSLEPWSRYLTGTQGRSPGYDPLAFFVAEARKRGLAVHAWLNPYRAAANAGESRAANHISKQFPQYAYKIGSVLWMDPGAPQVRKHIVNVARDLAKRYDLAGVHLDDYFYPYPTNSGAVYPFPDDRTYAAYREAGGTLARADWRRDNVNTLVREIGAAVRSAKPGIVFGVSPFGIYTKGSPPDVKAGVDQYHDLFSDPVKWMREGWVDYLAPQLYWAEGGPQSFSSLLRWWRSQPVNPRGVPVWPGIAVDRMSSHGWPASEIAKQLALEQSVTPRGRGGFLLWNIGAIQKNTKGVVSVIR